MMAVIAINVPHAAEAHIVSVCVHSGADAALPNEIVVVV
jgi:hypothetical protein